LAEARGGEVQCVYDHPVGALSAAVELHTLTQEVLDSAREAGAELDLATAAGTARALVAGSGTPAG
jgi:hypothetical protein